MPSLIVLGKTIETVVHGLGNIRLHKPQSMPTPLVIRLHMLPVHVTSQSPGVNKKVKHGKGYEQCAWNLSISILALVEKPLSIAINYIQCVNGFTINWTRKWTCIEKKNLSWAWLWLLLAFPIDSPQNQDSCLPWPGLQSTRNSALCITESSDVNVIQASKSILRCAFIEEEIQPIWSTKTAIRDF